MNEVDKMYRNANLISYYCGDGYIFDAMLEVECTNGDKEKCKTCNKAKTNYPPFTVEKQLDIIIFLINRKQPLLFSLDKGQEKISRRILEIGLAGIVNKIWQDLTDAEKAEIKNILESEVME